MSPMPSIAAAAAELAATFTGQLLRPSDAGYDAARILAPVDLTVDTTIALLESFGSAGVNVAEPLADLHDVPPTAPAGAASKPTGSTMAAVNKTLQPCAY